MFNFLKYRFVEVIIVATLLFAVFFRYESWVNWLDKGLVHYQHRGTWNTEW